MVLPDASQVPDTISDRDDAIAGFRSIEWDELARAGAFIDEADVRNLRDMEADTIEVVRADERLANISLQTLVKVLKNVTSVEKVQNYALTRVEDLLAVNLKVRANALVTAEGVVDASPFMRYVIDASSNYAQKTASNVLALLFSVNPTGCETYLTWIVEHLRTATSEPSSARVAVKGSVVLLRDASARQMFHEAGGLPLLAAALRSRGSAASAAQMLYEGAFALWTLTYHKPAVLDMLPSGALGVLMQLVSTGPREKVIRVAMAALKNVVESGDGPSVEAMIAKGLPATLEQLRGRRWVDPDIAVDLETVRVELRKNHSHLSTLERYEVEVSSGLLSWGILHDPMFFKEHVHQFEQNNFAIVRKLVDHLGANDALVVAVACHDIGLFCQYYPNGKSIVNHMGGKERVMALLAHGDPDVQKNALGCISKLMLQHWEAVKA